MTLEEFSSLFMKVQHDVGRVNKLDPESQVRIIEGLCSVLREVFSVEIGLGHKRRADVFDGLSSCLSHLADFEYGVYEKELHQLTRKLERGEI